MLPSGPPLRGLFGQALGRLLAVAENYPELKASQNFIDFQDALEDTENQIEMARRYYNGTVRELNTLVEQFPSNLVASTFGFIHADYFETEVPEDRAVPQVSFDKS
jgi:LemA protein